MPNHMAVGPFPAIFQGGYPPSVHHPLYKQLTMRGEYQLTHTYVDPSANVWQHYQPVRRAPARQVPPPPPNPPSPPASTTRHVPTPASTPARRRSPSPPPVIPPFPAPSPTRPGPHPTNPVAPQPTTSAPGPNPALPYPGVPLRWWQPPLVFPAPAVRMAVPLQPAVPHLWYHYTV